MPGIKMPRIKMPRIKMPDQRREFGLQSEDCAVLFLKKKGYVILERNYRTRFAEIDIIAQQGGFLVFIEVKARKNNKKGFPKEAVGFSKQKKISLAAEYYLREKKLSNVRVRFDVVAILENSNGIEIELIDNAFYAV